MTFDSLGWNFGAQHPTAISAPHLHPHPVHTTAQGFHSAEYTCSSWKLNLGLLLIPGNNGLGVSVVART